MDENSLPYFPFICPVRNRLLLLQLFLTNRLADTSAALVRVALRNDTAFHQLRARCSAWRKLIETVKDEMAFHRSQHHC
jgi:hypothetical protein